MVVIGIFVLTATFLKAVLFGLILAYFFQPLQQRYQSSFLENGLMARLIDLAKLVFVRPFAWIMGKVSASLEKRPRNRKCRSAAMPSCNRQSVGHAMPPCSQCRGWC